MSTSSTGRALTSSNNPTPVVLRGHSSSATALGWLERRLLVSGGADGLAQAWDAAPFCAPAAPPWRAHGADARAGASAGAGAGAGAGLLAVLADPRGVGVGEDGGVGLGARRCATERAGEDAHGASPPPPPPPPPLLPKQRPLHFWTQGRDGDVHEWAWPALAAARGDGGAAEPALDLALLDDLLPRRGSGAPTALAEAAIDAAVEAARPPQRLSTISVGFGSFCRIHMAAAAEEEEVRIAAGKSCL